MVVLYFSPALSDFTGLVFLPLQQQLSTLVVVGD
jgi:hypothetical protein